MYFKPSAPLPKIVECLFLMCEIDWDFEWFILSCGFADIVFIVFNPFKNLLVTVVLKKENGFLFVATNKCMQKYGS